MEEVQLLLDGGAAIDLDPRSGEGGKTWLHFTADRGHEELVQLLFYRGAGIEAKDRLGQESLS